MNLLLNVKRTDSGVGVDSCPRSVYCQKNTPLGFYLQLGPFKACHDVYSCFVDVRVTRIVLFSIFLSLPV